MRASALGGEPGGDRPCLVVGKALGDASHHRRRALARAKGLHRRDDLGRVVAAERRHLCLYRGAWRVAARTRRRSRRWLGRCRSGRDLEHQWQYPHPPRYARHALPQCGRGATQLLSRIAGEGGPSPKGLVGEGKTAHTGFRSWSFSGSERMRLPVAAKIALHNAGASGGTPGSPPPPQNPPLGTNTVSTTGISARRTIW